jgi:hypothetical protein
MPPRSNPYQRVMYNGIPFWRDPEGQLYYYSSSTPPTAEARICLGTEATGLFADWQTRLTDILDRYRNDMGVRPRAAAPAPPTT